MKKEYRNVIRTKKMIRAAFMDLLEEKKEIENISVTELAERADLSKSTFYYHYEDIFAVAEEIENELFDKLFSVLEKAQKEQSNEYSMQITSIVAFLKENEDIYRKAILSSSSQLFVDKLKSILTKKINSNPRLSFSQNANVRYVQVRFLTNAFVDTLVDYFNGILNVSLEQIGDIILSFVDKLV